MKQASCSDSAPYMEILYRGNIGIMENTMGTTIMVLYRDSIYRICEGLELADALMMDQG